MSTVLHIGTRDNTGGAARAAYRLHESLRRIGWSSSMAVGLRTSGDPDVTTLGAETAPFLPRGLRLAEGLAPRMVPYLGDMRLPLRTAAYFERTALFARTDVINLHNLHGNFFDFKLLRRWYRQKPLVWTLHDMWPMTGHCAYSYDCDRWLTGCHHCPLYTPQRKGLDDIGQTVTDTTRLQWRSKRKTYSNTQLTVVAPSRWLAAQAERSILMCGPGNRVVHIPYGVDEDVFRPIDQARVRRLLGIADEEQVILFAANTLNQERKGLGFLTRALASLTREIEGVRGIAFGAEAGLRRDGLNIKMLGDCASEELQALVYNAADVVCVPSLADNAPLVAIEALSCGVPVVSFDVGGVPELVRHMQNGYAARRADLADLTQGLRILLTNQELRARLSQNARRMAIEDHSSALQASRYAALYQTLLDRSKRSG